MTVTKSIVGEVVYDLSLHRYSRKRLNDGKRSKFPSFVIESVEQVSTYF